VVLGREEPTVDLLDGALADRRPVVVVGPSGVGKSSLVRAGLQPALAAMAGWPVVTITPTADPMAEWHRSVPGDGPRVLIVDQLEELFTLCEDEPGDGGSSRLSPAWRRATRIWSSSACAPTSTTAAWPTPSWWRSCGTTR
jgi:hypothetical protein